MCVIMQMLYHVHWMKPENNETQEAKQQVFSCFLVVVCLCINNRYDTKTYVLWKILTFIVFMELFLSIKCDLADTQNRNLHMSNQQL